MNFKRVNKIYILPLTAAIFTAVLFIKNSELASVYVKNGLKSCFLTIIPSLFPLMVVSEVLNSCGAMSLLGKLFGKAGKRLFCLPEKATAAVVSGLILGFPIGTRALISLYDNGEINKRQLCSALPFCGIPSFGFSVGMAGGLIFGNKSFGVALYIFAICSALLTGVIFAKRIKTRNDMSYTAKEKRQMSLSSIFSSAISSATESTLMLCGYVVFFSCLVGCLSASSSISTFVKGLLGAFFELSCGVVSSALSQGLTGIALCGFCIGWSGLSVHFQAMALVGERIDGYIGYMLKKLFQGVLCSLSAVLYALISGYKGVCDTALPTFLPMFTEGYTAFMISLFILSFVSTKKNCFK